MGEQLTWHLFKEHRNVYHRNILSSKDADALGVNVSTVMREYLETGGAVLPHYHDVAEVIHIIKGKVKRLQNGEWLTYQDGDTFIVPEGVVHSVFNADTEPTEQVSIFLPVSDGDVKNSDMKSFMVDEGNV
ncbi:hypothetical protein GCM10028778_15860 [Barrientosiimonas marina]|uniref:Cupin domain-containing protein n=1 Tax=Lentibacillus kimchii TaxID=1542911 RepID=A0ABW2UTR4_9BACI